MASNDYVVVLPGIMGSVLEKNGEDVWALSLGALVRAAVHRDLRELALAEDPPDVDDLGDGVRATRLLTMPSVVPGFWKVDGYGRIVREIAQRMSVPAENVLPFPYDWRLDNRVAARALAKRVDDVRAQHPDARFTFVGHSMGGLVARYYAEKLGGWRHTRALFTLGTPHRGSLNAVETLVNGLSKRIGPLKLLDLTDTLRTFTSLYQLLPIYPCVRIEGQIARVTEVALPNVDPARVAAGVAFHREIEAAVEANLADPEYRARFPFVFPIVGTNQPTSQLAELDGSAVRMLDTYPGLELDGDGTVPRVSATPIELSDLRREMFTACTHAMLQSSTAALDQLGGMSGSQDLPYGQFRVAEAALDVPLSLELEDAFYADEPVWFRVRPGREPVTLQAEIKDELQKSVATTRLRRSADGWHAPPAGTWRLRLDPGTYRLTVSGPHAVPIEDVFLVLDERRERAPAPVPVAETLLFAPPLPAAPAPASEAAPPKPSKKTGQKKERELAGGRKRRAFAVEAEPEGGLPTLGGISATVGPEEMVRGAGPAAAAGAPAEGAALETRYPSMAASDVVPGAEVTVDVGLTVERGSATAGEPVAIQAGKVLDVRVDSEHVEFGEDTGRIAVAAGDSTPVRFRGLVKRLAMLLAEVEIRAVFRDGSRIVGTAIGRFAVKQAAASTAATPTPVAPAGPVPAPAPASAVAPPPAPTPAEVESRGVLLLDGAEEPALQIDISGTRGSYVWRLVVSRAASSRVTQKKLKLPRTSREAKSLPDPDPAGFVRGLYREIEARKGGPFRSLLRGGGFQLWQATPQAFRDHYKVLASALAPEELTIQLSLDEHVVPWELMLVPLDAEETSWEFLYVRHPVARWPVNQGASRPDLPAGRIAVIAPAYAGGNALPAAAQELKLLSDKPWSAYPLRPATTRALADLLSGALPVGQPIAAVHLACHGMFTDDAPHLARIVLEDGDLTALEVQDPANRLGDTTGPLVFMNACQVGQSGTMLAGMSGFAGAWIARGYRAVVAPLWMVNDPQAFAVTREFYELALRDGARVPVAEALRQVRVRRGATSNTPMSYLFYGDVTARFQ